MTAGAFTLALRSYRMAAATFACRHAGRPLPAGLPDWLDPQAINSLWLALPGGGSPVLGVGLRDGVPHRALPRHCRLSDLFGPHDHPDEALPLHCLPARRAVAQGEPPGLRPSIHPTLQGTGTALLVDRAGAQHYLLTCGHVAAPNLAAAAGQPVRIVHSGVTGTATLREWQPSLAAGAYRTKIDAALLEIDEEQRRELRADGALTPSALGGRPSAEQLISLRRRGAPVDGRLKVFWSGPVDVPGLTPGIADYFLDDAIGYRSSVTTQGGDSGAAIWDEHDRLMGMHIAGLPSAGIDEPNAIYGAIQPVLDWFPVAPLLRGGVSAAATPAPAATRQVSPPIGSGQLPTLDIIACTIWGEARNQGERGMRAVGCVIANRARTHYRGKQNAAEVCLDRWQFSCWNAGDANLAKLRTISGSNDAQYAVAKRIAAEVQAETLGDITDRARHYYATTLRNPPFWALGKTPCKVIGDHRFFNDIA